MSETLVRVRELIARGEVRISEHGYDELVADGLTVAEILGGVEAAQVVEDYPTYPKGPCVLVRQTDRDERPIHVVWGIPAGKATPAVLVTAYRPEASKWSADFRTRQ